MNKKDLGIDPANRQHNKLLTVIENRFLGILWTDHVGAENKISANELAVKFDCAMEGFEPEREQIRRLKQAHMTRWYDQKKRKVRHMHNHLLTMHDNIPILSKAGIGGGYWIAESKTEANEFYDTFRKRGMTGLVKASRGKKSTLVDIMEQVTFEFESLSGNTDMYKDVLPDDHAAIAVVDAFLGRMLENPEKFSSGLRKLNKKYGSVMLDKAEVAAMKSKAAELSRLVDALGT